MKPEEIDSYETAVDYHVDKWTDPPDLAEKYRHEGPIEEDAVREGVIYGWVDGGDSYSISGMEFDPDDDDEGEAAGAAAAAEIRKADPKRYERMRRRFAERPWTRRYVAGSGGGAGDISDEEAIAIDTIVDAALDELADEDDDTTQGFRIT